MSGIDPRLAAAFDEQAGRLRRALVVRVVVTAAALAAAFYLRHWAAWLALAVVAVTQGLVALFLPWVLGRLARDRAAFEADPTALVWMHAGPDARARRQRVELHQRDGEVVTLYVSDERAAGALEAARAMSPAPTITTDDAGHAEAADRHRLAGKLWRLEAAVRAAKAPGLQRQADGALAAIAAWRERLFHARDDPYRGARSGAPASGPVIASPRWAELPVADVEKRLDELLVHYRVSDSSEGHRRKMEAIMAEKRIPEGLVRTELFTDDIAAQIAALQAQADRTRP